jgi:hypothetical protein
LPTFLIYAIPAVLLAVVFGLVGRHELRRAKERRRMEATVLRLELEEAKQQERGTEA